MRYSEINALAEETADSIYRQIGSEMPSKLELLGWIEKTFGKKVHISHRDTGSFGHHLGLVYFSPVEDAFKVLLKEGDYSLRQNFTLVHEFAHIIRCSQLAYGLSDGNLESEDEEERYCNHFAAAFLMPREIFIRKWNEINDDIDFKKFRMVSLFQVSGESVYYRAKELGLIA